MQEVPNLTSVILFKAIPIAIILLQHFLINTLPIYELFMSDPESIYLKGEKVEVFQILEEF